jgi:lambda repressor-like predicted transcriptional regulator
MHNERLRVLLLERGLKPDDLAAALDVDPKTVERWITKARVPYRKHRYATAAFFGVDEAEIWPSALTSAQVAACGTSETRLSA